MKKYRKKKGVSNINRKKAKQRRLMRRYFAIVFSIVFVFLVGFSLVAVGYNALNEKDTVIAGPVSKEPASSNADPSNIPQEEPEPAERVNVAVFGTDEDGVRADVNFVVSFDTGTKKISLISIPRDTKITMTSEMIEDMTERGRKQYIPWHDNVKGQCKLTELHAYAGEGHRNQFSVMALEDLLGIEINYYVEVDIQGFRDIVDAVGGIDMEVQDRLYYSDPVQGLYIDLYPGYQHLDGKKAEMLVRYRDGYAQKDLKRIQVQQDFMREFMKKVTSTDTILSSLPSLIKVMFQYVETDISVFDALKYVKYVGDIKMENVTMETIPGEGGSYFTPDEEGVKELVDRVFYGKEPIVEEPLESSEEETVQTKTVSDSKSLRIEVANGGVTKGMAAKQQEYLEEQGYNVPLISTYTGEQQQKTRIIIGKKGIGQDLLKYYKNAEFEVNPSLLSDGTDIKIIIGLEVQ